ncbi:reverse transcriptase domain-containing protein [Tanacetum coccineum]
MVPTGTPIKQALTGLEKTRRVAKWAIKLGEHDIIFLKRDKRERPADFLPEIPFNDSEKKVKEKEVSDSSNEWKLYTDEASSPDGTGAGLMLIDPAGKEYTYALRFEFKTTNNEVEYEVLLAGLRIAQEMEIMKVAIFLDSQLVVNQIKGTYAVKQLLIKSCLQKINRRKEVLKVEIEEKRSWMSPIQGYLLSGLLPEDTKESRKIRIQVQQYKLIQGNLYKISFFTPWLRCIAPPQTDKIIKEIHEGSCGFNAKPRLMVVRITKQGYYWLSMHREAAKAIQDCDKCKEQSAIRKARADGAIAVGNNLAKELWVHRTVPRNSQEETPFSLTYGFEVVVPIVEATDDKGRMQETTKKGKEIASIEKAHYRNKDGEGFTILAGGHIGFEEGAKDIVASWEEHTGIWVLEGIGFYRVGGFFDSKASTEAEESATVTFRIFRSFLPVGTTTLPVGTTTLPALEERPMLQS